MFDFWDSMFGQFENIVLCLKEITQKGTAFLFGKTNLYQAFTKCVSDWYAHFDILACQMWLQVKEYHLILLRFSGHFHTLLTSINVWIIVSSPKFHRLCVWSMHTFWYVIMPYVTAGYGRFSDLIVFFGNFHILLNVWNVITSPNFYKLCIYGYVSLVFLPTMLWFTFS